MNDAVLLAQQLVRLDTSGHGEGAAADLVAQRLEGRGVECARHQLAPGRDSLVCRLRGRDAQAPALCLTGHLDTVAVGSVPWTHDPHGGRLDRDTLWGRGSAEPTSNRVAVAHKGAAWIRLRASGVAAHASTPHLGINAIEVMAHALARLDSLEFRFPPHPDLGGPTVNIGTIAGGSAPNVVPDRCDTLLDVRLVPGFGPDEALAEIQRAVGPLAEVTIDRALAPVGTSPEDPWLRRVLARVGGEPCGVLYFTIASELAPAAGGVPVAVVGPGDPALAHQVDERCSIAAIERAAELYEQIALDWTIGEALP